MDEWLRVVSCRVAAFAGMVLHSREVVYETRTTVLQSAKSFLQVTQMIQSSKKSDRKQQAAAKVGSATKRTAQYDRYNQQAARTEEAEFGITDGGGAVQAKDTASAEAASGGGPRKKKSVTPIIIVPANVDATINMYNVRQFLEEGKYESPAAIQKSNGMKPSNVAVNKKRGGGAAGSSHVPYKVVDNIAGMSREDWDRVVACFITGPEWELKRWPLFAKGGPPGVFTRVKGFYMHMEDQKVHENAKKWDVTSLKMSKYKRHLDKTMQRKFWEVVDAHTQKNRADLRI